MKTDKEKIEVMEAHGRGEPIEMISYYSPENWVQSLVPCWDWVGFDYRIKPTPKLRPWTPEEVPVGALLRGTIGGSKTAMILSVSNDGKAFFLCRQGKVTSNFLGCGMMSCEHSTDHGKTWHPCGVLEVSK